MIDTMSNPYESRESTPEEVAAAAHLTAWASTHLDPLETALTARSVPGVREYAVHKGEEASGRQIPKRSAELAGHAFKNIFDAYALANFFGKDSVDERLALVTDPDTIIAISSLANRREELMLSDIGGYPGGRSALRLAANGRHIVLPEARSSAHRCPYSKQPGNEQEPHALMKLFAPWAGQAAVHITELYRTNKT